jgi:hypothetical protein
MTNEFTQHLVKSFGIQGHLLLQCFVVKYAIINCFYHLPWRTIEMTIIKMVDFDTSCKHMGWYGLVLGSSHFFQKLSVLNLCAFM